MLGAVSDPFTSIQPDGLATEPATALAGTESATEVGDGASSALSSVVHVLAATEALLRDTEVALTRLEAGTYSKCELCGEPIAQEILSRSPLARRCEAHEG